MLKILSVIKLSAISASIVMIFAASPVSILAAPGVNGPTGSDAKTYIYNEETGLWENDHYTYNPTTNRTTSKDPVVYTYNSSTGQWDTTAWAYNAPSGTYYSYVTSVATPPAGATTIGGPEPVITPAAAPSTHETTEQPTEKAVATTEPSSGSGVNVDGSTTLNGNNNTNASIGNIIGSAAATGNASVIANTKAGNATTGNAQAMANVINLLQSSSSGFNPDDPNRPVIFTSDINGDVTGDILIDPAKISTYQPAGGAANLGGDLKINSNNDVNATINNDIDIGATTGNAKLSQNTTAGNATSGNATAVANVMNVINSVISSGKSFLGVLNINGNLNGDILLPQEFIDQLLSSNAPVTTVDAASLTNTANLTNNTSQSIVNDVNTNAQTGIATVAENTKAGNATTGAASTNVNIYNLTGSNVIGKNALLVFVNVLGTWVGMIVNAPQGATAAGLGGGITSTSASTETDMTNNTNQSITNHINANATTGDAEVSQNTKAGNATTGNAKVAVNLANILSSNFSLSNWFGILFINVFGSWHGSFGVNTTAGSGGGSPVGSTNTGTSSSNSNNNTRVFSFAPTGQPDQYNVAPVSDDFTTTSGGAPTEQENIPVVLGATDSEPLPPVAPTQSGVNHDWTLPIAGATIAFIMLGGERLVDFRKRRAAGRFQAA